MTIFKADIAEKYGAPAYSRLTESDPRMELDKESILTNITPFA